MKHTTLSILFIIIHTPTQPYISEKETHKKLLQALEQAIELFPEIKSTALEIEKDTSQTRKYVGSCSQTQALRIVLQYYLTLFIQKIDGDFNKADSKTIIKLIELHDTITQCEEILEDLKIFPWPEE